ncbi:MAG: CocE/NonD family hydrolase C-terminal non-catalytic domain-containing protein [Planctomycetota bacterium]
MLVCASFSDHNLHTVGSFRAFREASSEHKWVYTHRGGKWDVYYDPAVQDFTRRFMDCFVKGERENGFLEVPSVRLEVRASRDEITAVRDETEWPPSGTFGESLYLRADGTLSDSAATSPSALTIDAKGGEQRFSYRFTEDRELVGPMTLHLQLSLQGDATPASDAGFCVYVFKRDAGGNQVPFRGSVGSTNDPITRGYGRAAMRALDDERSTPLSPTLRGTELEPLEAGEVVSVPIALWESATFFEGGSSLELLVATYEAVPSPPYAKDLSFNEGRVEVHVGGDHGSRLVVPRR